jgi:hypothetical protein
MLKCPLPIVGWSTIYATASLARRFPVTQDDGCLLLNFTAGSEDAPNRLDGEIPLTAALVVLRHGPGPLLRGDEQKDKRGEVEGQSANEAKPMMLTGRCHLGHPPAPCHAVTA